MSRLPLVLAIEPDVRQGAIVKRVLKERVQAEVLVVDSRDAAIAAIRTAIPDVVLVSMLLSPRDEDDLVKHLRTLEGAAHLQTHTIPQLASALGRGDDDGGGGLFSSFRKKKPAASAPAGCDPDLFADEIRVYLERAAAKKREAAASGSVAPMPAIGGRPFEAPAAPVEEVLEPATGSSWASPFEWRPTADRRMPQPAPEASAAAESPIPHPDSSIADPPAPIPSLESLDLGSPTPDFPIPDSAIVDSPVSGARFLVPPPPVHTPAPFSVWARKEATPVGAAPPEHEVETFFARLGMPDGVASVAYPDGVRIRRVRVRTAKESMGSLHGAMLLGKRMLAELRGNEAPA